MDYDELSRERFRLVGEELFPKQATSSPQQEGSPQHAPPLASQPVQRHMPTPRVTPAPTTRRPIAMRSPLLLNPEGSDYVQALWAKHIQANRRPLNYFNAQRLAVADELAWRAPKRISHAMRRVYEDDLRYQIDGTFVQWLAWVFEVYTMSVDDPESRAFELTFHEWILVLADEIR